MQGPQQLSGGSCARCRAVQLRDTQLGGSRLDCRSCPCSQRAQRDATSHQLPQNTLDMWVSCRGHVAAEWLEDDYKSHLRPQIT
mmetsp:Transcript_23502/g.74111  ORF Transcript_23502/g.74111 Transcript_23502/m.74111 type:complete len:84 (-) Transcript_23502:7-258(-)